MKRRKQIPKSFLVAILIAIISGVGYYFLLQGGVSLPPIPPSPPPQTPIDYLSTLSWIENSGVLATNNRIYCAIKYSGGSWVLDSGQRIDAQCEVAMAFLYHYQLSGDTRYKDKAIALLKQARIDSTSISSRIPMCSWYANDACYTQDNARMMRGYALGVEITHDATLTQILTDLADFWASKTPTDGGVGVGINAPTYGNYLDPPQYPCARHIGELLVGMVRTYEAIGKSTYKDAASKMGNWLVNNQQSDGRWIVPRGTNHNGGLGNEIEAASLSLRGLALLYKIILNTSFKVAADKAFNWLKSQCEATDSNWHKGRLPSEYHRSVDLRYFNTLYMFTPAGLIDYYKYCGNSATALEIAREILNFMKDKMMMHGSALIEGGICGEWDLSTDTRSTFVDDERMIWGNWIFVGWTNCEFIEACAMLAS